MDLIAARLTRITGIHETMRVEAAHDMASPGTAVAAPVPLQHHRVADAMKPEHFPQTRKTWILDQLENSQEGRAEVNNHVMSVYAAPLKAYFMGTPWRKIGDPDDIVQGFFADRLARDGFYENWHRKGMQLRRWLMNAMRYYLQEQVAKRPVATIPDKFDHADDAPSPDELVDREFARSVVRRAMELAEADCFDRGLSDHWRIFVALHIDQRELPEIGRECGISSERARVMARTAGRKFKRAVRDMVARDVDDTEQVDREIEMLMEVLR